MKTISKYLTQEPNFKRSVVAFLIKEDQVLLGLRLKVSNNLGKNLISGIGGKLEAGESDEDALVRELEEEINVSPLEYSREGNVKFLFPHKPSWQQDVSIFLVREWSGQPTRTEVIDPAWFPLDDLPWEQMWDDNAYWLPQILQGEQVDAVYLYNDHGKVQEELLLG